VKSVNLFFVIGLVLAVGGIVEKITRGRSQAETNALMEMIGGGAAAVIGLVLMFARGREKSR